MLNFDVQAGTEPSVPRSAVVAIHAGGGEYLGIQSGLPQTGVPDLVLFNDPLTGTTLALIVNAMPITARRVRTKIARSRFAYAAFKRGRGD